VPQALRFDKALLLLPECVSCTLLMCTPSERWMPLHSMQIMMPKLMDAHSGAVAWADRQSGRDVSLLMRSFRQKHRLADTPMSQALMATKVAQIQ
jgi:hypothetical protein